MMRRWRRGSSPAAVKQPPPPECDMPPPSPSSLRSTPCPDDGAVSLPSSPPPTVRKAPSLSVPHYDGASDTGTARTSPDPLGSCKSNTVEEELREALIAHDSLTQTVQGFYRKIQKQSAQIEVYERLLAELNRMEGEEMGEGPIQHEPDLWSAWEMDDDDDEGEGEEESQGVPAAGQEGMAAPPPLGGGVAQLLPYPPRVNSAVATARLTSQIIEELHASQRELAIQTEEKNQLEDRAQRLEVAHAQLKQDKLQTERVISHLRAELRVLKLQLRAHRTSEVNLEMEVQTVHLQQEQATSSLPFWSLSSPHGSSGPPSNCGVDVSALPEEAGEEKERIQAVMMENRTLRAELEATQTIAAQEIKRRMGLERELAQLRKLLPSERLGGEAEGRGEVKAMTGGELVEEHGDGDDTDVLSELMELEPVSLILKGHLGPLRELNPQLMDMWGPAETPFRVRGLSYMADGVKVESREPLFELIHVEMFDVETGRHIPRADNVVASLPDGLLSHLQDSPNSPFLLALNFQVPGTPCCSVVVYFALKYAYRLLLEREIAALQVPASSEKALTMMGMQEASTAAGGAQDDLNKVMRLLAKFILGDEEYRNSRFKLIPSMVKGPWVVRTAVGTKPVLLGRKLTQRYFTGPGYLEVDVDIGSSSIASRVLALVRDYSQNIVVETAILIQVGHILHPHRAVHYLVDQLDPMMSHLMPPSLPD